MTNLKTDSRASANAAKDLWSPEVVAILKSRRNAKLIPEKEAHVLLAKKIAIIKKSYEG
jgi:hypothetical protein